MNVPTHPSPEWHTVADVAAQLRVSTSTIRRYLKLRLLHGYKQAGKWTIDPESVRAFKRDYKGERV